MHKNSLNRSVMLPLMGIVLCLLHIALAQPAIAEEDTTAGETLYRQLSSITSGKGDIGLIKRLNAGARQLDWSKAADESFVGNLRILRDTSASDAQSGEDIYLLRKLSGELFILSVPENPAERSKEANSAYAGLDNMYENKLTFNIKVMQGLVGGQTYAFASLIEKPQQLPLDRIFKICIILMLFFVMVGMGLTLTFKDFALVFTKPRGIILGQILQFGAMPLLAMALGHLLGFYEAYPFIFVGMILITAIPGGVTSNLMTYYAKGDLALSISLTSFSTVLSLIFTPLLLALYCANLPEITIPVKIVMQTIMILVIIPLIVGMSVRGKWPGFAEKTTPFFSALGIIALLFVIIAGVLSNLNMFADTARYGFKFYSTVFTMTMLGMVLGIVFSKLIGINNYQTRAISLETGLRNSALAMTIALLIQDTMGDFYSSMFVTSGIFGLTMYVAGIIAIFMYKPLLPIETKL